MRGRAEVETTRSERTSEVFIVFSVNQARMIGFSGAGGLGDSIWSVHEVDNIKNKFATFQHIEGSTLHINILAVKCVTAIKIYFL